MSRTLTLAALVIANIYAWTLSAPQGLEVSFLDVGEGNAIFVQAPGAQVLIDGGPVGGGVLRGIGAAIPFFDRTLDAVIETTPLSSESGGLIDVFNRYQVENFLSPPVAGDTKTASMLSRAAAEEHTNRVTLAEGARVMLGGGAYIDVISPRADAPKLDAHTGALVLRIVYGKTSLLISSELPQKQELALAASGVPLQSDVLGVGEHGSKSSSAPAFIAAASPRYAVISRGCGNRFGHPATSTLDTLRAVGARIFDTCTSGATTFISNGRSVAPL